MKRKTDTVKTMKCEEIQTILFSYMTHELGAARSDLVREHLRKCEVCRQTAAETQSTLDLLKSASKTTSDIPSRLSDKRRKTIIRALTHPALDWMVRHHALFSITAAILAALLACYLVARLPRWKVVRYEDPCYPVKIGHPLESGEALEDMPEPPKETNRLDNLLLDKGNGITAPQDTRENRDVDIE